MRNIWKAIKKAWQDYWTDDESDDTKMHLSQSDKRILFYGAFMICFSAIAFSSIVVAFNNLRVSHENEKDMEQLMGMVSAYMASATKDEYDEIAEQIRHDLIINEFSNDPENFVKYIPNTANPCCLEGGFAEQVYLLCTNNASIYELGLFAEETDDDNDGHISVSFGFDEISETRIRMEKIAGEKSGTANIEPGRGILSVHRMKTLFCDDCIGKILSAVKKQIVEKFVIFDAEHKQFYPVEEGTIVIGDYELQTEYCDGSYEITIKYIDQ